MASLESKFNPEKFHCGTCITQYGTSERLVAKTKLKRKSKGCFDYTSKKHRIDNVRFYNCIGNHATPIDFYVEAFSLYEKGMLPFKGTLGDQPNKIMVVFQLIEVRRNVIAEQKAKNQGR